jgi:S-formylglutathione hydrolase FrmB
MKFFLFFLWGIIFLACTEVSVKAQGRFDAAVTIIDTSHFSKVFNEKRHYRIFLPPGYYTSQEKRYPVIYYFHGYAGRYNGPADGIQSQSAESRYYDEFNGNIERCGPDSLDNFAEYVRTHDVIVAKWDGYVKSQYPRPYDVGPVVDDIQFVDYFPEFVKCIDNNYRTLASRQGRAISGLSMGGFMSLNIASKYPHLISSASFFNPAVGFIIGPRALQIYTPFDEMGRSYIGLPIRMHIGNRDFLRQHNLDAFNNFKKLELFFESWHYGINYFQGYHYVVNVEGQFDFHLKHFKKPAIRPPFWYHIDVYPDFEIWGYQFDSNRDVPGYTTIDEACQQGLKISTKRWLPEGHMIPDVNIKVSTDGLYMANTTYHLISLGLNDHQIYQKEVESDEQGRIHFEVKGSGADIGIYREGDPGFISMADYRLDSRFPEAWEVISLTPLLFNKGGKAVDNIEIDLVSLDEDLEVIDDAQKAGPIQAGDTNDKISFRIRSRSVDLDRAKLKLMVKYSDREDRFLLEVPFYSSENILESYQIADGRTFITDKGEEIKFGEGNGDGIADPGERISILTQSDLRDDCWYGLKLYTDDPNIIREKEEIIWSFRDTYIGNMRPTSEVFISPDCPEGHEIKFQGVYDFQKRGSPVGNFQAAHSFIHETHRVQFQLVTGRK